METFKASALILVVTAIVVESSCGGDWVPIRSHRSLFDEQYATDLYPPPSYNPIDFGSPFGPASQPYDEPTFGNPELHFGFTPIVRQPGVFDPNLLTSAVPVHQSKHTFSTVNAAVPYAVPHPVPFHVTKPFGVPVHVPVPFDVPRGVHVPVPVPHPVPVERPVPIGVPRPVPVPFQQRIPYQVTHAFPVPVPHPIAVHQQQLPLSQEGSPPFAPSEGFADPVQVNEFSSFPQSALARKGRAT